MAKFWPRKMRCVLFTAISSILVFLAGNTAFAHPLVQNTLDVVIGPGRVVIDAKVTIEELLLVATVAGKAPSEAELQTEKKNHAEYLLRHIHVRADGKTLAGKAIFVPDKISTRLPDGVKDPTDGGSDMANYQLEFPVATPPKVVVVEQDLLREYDGWTASCILRIRQSDQDAWDLSLLNREKPATFDCVWSPETATPEMLPVDPKEVHTNVAFGRTFGAYLWHGIEHILTGYDHLLFVSALVLATARFWDLLKVVTAFTLAHSLTLALSVFNVLTLSSRIVEPMIAASIVFVAVQNVFWPRQSRGWTRLLVAFAFGLFHGLGFAGGLKDAMSDMPQMALWLALIAFSLGVEIGHQVVVIPLFTAISVAKKKSANFAGFRPVFENFLRAASGLIALGGIYFFWQAVSA